MSHKVTSRRGQEMLASLPPYYEMFREMNIILDTQGHELDDLRSEINCTLDQRFVNTATWGLDRWEKYLGLESYSDKPVDQRRSRVISKIRGVGTVTVALIKNVSESYDGGTVEVTEHPEIGTIKITFIDTIGIPPNLEDLMVAIEEIKPAHLAVEYVFNYTAWEEILSTTWDHLRISTWDDLLNRRW